MTLLEYDIFDATNSIITANLAEIVCQNLFHKSQPFVCNHLILTFAIPEVDSIDDKNQWTEEFQLSVTHV